MRDYLLLGFGFVLLVITCLVIVGYPFWLYAIAMGSMLNEPNISNYWIYILMAIPALVLTMLWGGLVLIARLTRHPTSNLTL
jgi:hypothetical protein